VSVVGPSLNGKSTRFGVQLTLLGHVHSRATGRSTLRN